MQPLGAFRRLVDERRELRGDELRQCPAFSCPGLLFLLLLLGIGGRLLFPVPGPHPIRLRRNLFHAAAGRDAPRLLLEQDVAVAGPRLAIALLDQEPVVRALAPRTSAHPHQRPCTLELVAMQHELELALRIAFLRIFERLPRAAIPDHDGSAAILALGYDPFEAGVVDRMVFDMNGEPLVSRIHARPARDRPTLHRAVQLEPEIVVKTGGRMLLDDEAVAPGGGLAALRLRGDLEIPLGAIAHERVGVSAGATRARSSHGFRTGHPSLQFRRTCTTQSKPGNCLVTLALQTTVSTLPAARRSLGKSKVNQCFTGQSSF